MEIVKFIGAKDASASGGRFEVPPGKEYWSANYMKLRADFAFTGGGSASEYEKVVFAFGAMPQNQVMGQFIVSAAAQAAALPGNAFDNITLYLTTETRPAHDGLPGIDVAAGAENFWTAAPNNTLGGNGLFSLSAAAPVGAVLVRVPKSFVGRLVVLCARN